MKRVAIAGGGIAGLALAHRLVRRGAEVGGLEIVVLEKTERPGGNIRSERIDGHLCEWGPNGFLDSVPETLALVRELGIADRIQPSDDAARRRFIFRKGKLHLLPGGILEFLTSGLLSWPGKLRIAGEPFARRRPDGDETIRAFAARRIGSEAADVLVGSMVSGIFAGDAAALSLRGCFPKMWQMETDHGGLFKALLALRKKKKSGAGLETLAPVRGAQDAGAGARKGDALGAPAGRLTSFYEGTEELIRALVRDLGPSVVTGANVLSITEVEPGPLQPGPATSPGTREADPDQGSSARPAIHEASTIRGALGRAGSGDPETIRCGLGRVGSGDPETIRSGLGRVGSGDGDKIRSEPGNVGSGDATPPRSLGRVASADAGSSPSRRYRLEIEGREPLFADAVVLAGPAGASAAILDRIEPGASSLLRRIPTAPIAVVCFGYDSSRLDRPLDGFGYLIPRGEGPRILGALWDSSIFPGRAPRGRALIRCMVGGALDPEGASLEEGDLVGTVRGDLEVTMSLRTPPDFIRVFRHPMGIPQYTVGHLDRLARIEGLLARHPGVFLAGNSYRGVSINSCVQEADPLAEKVLASLRQP